MKAEFHGPCEVIAICKCGADLKIEEVQHQGPYKTLYIKPCRECLNNEYIAGYNEADC